MPFALPLLKRIPPLRSVERMHEVAGRTLPLRVVQNHRARRLTLRIDTGGRGLRVTTPPGIAKREIDQFLYRHEDWITQRLKEIPVRPEVRPGIRLPLRGVPHRIVHEPAARGTVKLDRSDPDAPRIVVYGERAHLPRRLADFLKREARRDIEKLVEKHCAAIGKRATAIRYRDTSSRWGSCTATGTLSFSWRIMMAPRPVIDYLVAHEVAHLKELNHGPKFWRLCEKLCPATEECKAWLKKNGNALQAFKFS
jgi:predicted metal-dependent hydrolase